MPFPSKSNNFSARISFVIFDDLGNIGVFTYEGFIFSFYTDGYPVEFVCLHILLLEPSPPLDMNFEAHLHES